ncbi:CaiB/BaiF CoA-transferase family protein [Acidisphaera sp. L21]|uniref:CaiB/BaiF CoA transferase family protein n=1 Tax=Acidisphaera sp. L21 TaxID=1641851 RepID=UPI00131D2F70|nr:CoA transferase [Acidisphaera sp. L21]
MLPLAGIKVVEIAQNLSGPYAAEILATLGAEVTKIERPGGDDARGWGPPFTDGAASTFQTVNRNKTSVTLDLKSPADCDRLHALIAEADVLVQNLRPGSLDALGFDAATLRAKHPRLVYCSLWAFGAVGPMRLDPGYEPMVQAFSGLFGLNGAADGPPSRVGVQVLDLGSGVWTALGCIAALFRRQTTGEGCVIDTSLLETALGWMSVPFASFATSGVVPMRHRTGNPKLVVFEALPTSDGELVVAAANDRLFAKLVNVLGHPEWAADPRYASNAGRVEHKDEVIGDISAVMATMPTAHWAPLFNAAGVPFAPINDLSDLLQDPQVAALGMLQDIPGLGIKTIGLPISFDGVRPAMRTPAPPLEIPHVRS